MNPIEPLLAAIQATVVLGLLFIVPGLALGPIVAPGSGTPLMRLGRAAGVSLLTVALACTVLARLGLLRPTIVLAVVAGLSILPLHARLPPVPRLPVGRARRWWLGAGAGAAVALALVVVPSRLEVGDDLLPFTSTVWYYANLARAVATEGAFPAQLAEWGALRAFQSDYLPVTAHTAAALQLLPGDLLAQLETYRLAVLVAGLLVATLLFRRWVSTWIALCGAIALLATERLAFKFVSYKPETFALVLALFALWLLDRALTERSRRLAISAALTAGGVFLCHAEVFLVLAAAAAGLATARWLVAPGGGPEAAGGLGPRHGRRLGVRLRLDRRALAAPAIAAAVVLAGAVGGALANGALTGELRIVGYVTGDRGAEGTPPLVGVGEVPPGWSFTGDPTWDFYVAAVAPGQLGREPPASFTDRRLLPRAIAHVWPGLDARSGQFLVVLVGLLAAPLLAWPLLDARRQRFLLGWWVFGAALLAGSYLLFALSDTYVPQRVGPRRLMPYELFLPVVAVTWGLWALDRVLRAGWRALVPRGGAMVAAGAALALVTAGAIAPAPVLPGDPDDREPGMTPAGYEAYRWIAANTPAEARLLTNAYTDGSVSGLAERVGLVDGRAVYLEDEAFLAESTALVLGARVVFLEPDGVPAGAYLERHGVTHVLAVSPDGDGSDLGGYLPFETDLGAMRTSDRYTLVRTFGEGRLLLFEVGPPA